MPIRPNFAALLLPLLLLMTGCNADNLGSLHLRVEDDLAAEVLVLRVETAPDAVSSLGETEGANWIASARLTSTSGRIEDLNNFQFGGITFDAHMSGVHRAMAITIPRGPDAAWPGLLTIADPAVREELDTLLESSRIESIPTRKRAQIGRTVKIAITLPGPPISSELRSRVSGVKNTVRKLDHLVELVIPIELITSPGDPIEWRIQW